MSVDEHIDAATNLLRSHQGGLLWPKPWMSWSAGSFAYAGRTERVVSVIRGTQFSATRYSASSASLAITLFGS